ncbi:MULTISPECIES: DUF397 domain-containing protein [unclassified Streptomyces]|uniref:DUF397 domain-containing protein n=1 Tax=unclassified Streptomyces TaxID=2593676 RepID=UPI00081DC7A2|nr:MULTISPECIES: DUF397 domain-containing protein [unclassified Streptomyces]MYR28888.1 DUF397 domain-containing protein [Streptomyces sp. SID4945]SCF42162.1 protein of unknown function [Streptomyces sp. LcepLS]
MTAKPSSEDRAELMWFKSSYSGANDNDCVEVAVGPRVLHVRDSKDVDGSALGFAPAAWTRFVAAARA